MVASTSSSAPLVVIVGITGTQGGSVASALLSSDKEYRLVGLSRDASKPASKAWSDKGVTMKGCTIAVGNEEQVKQAFEGADVVFVSWTGLRSDGKQGTHMYLNSRRRSPTRGRTLTLSA